MAAKKSTPLYLIAFAGSNAAQVAAMQAAQTAATTAAVVAAT